MQDLVKQFYTSFTNLDAAAMAACYHHEAVFNDEVFTNLKGKEPGFMWQMLISRSKGNLKINFSNIQAFEDKGSADWVAEYNFSATGRKVINQIHSEFEFKEGLIFRQKDSFDFQKWASQAMGCKGWLLSHFGFFKRKLQQKAKISLEKYIQKQE
jgi:hypothetical protein